MLTRITAAVAVLALSGCVLADQDSNVRTETREIGERISHDTDTLRQVEREIEEQKYFACIKLQRDGISKGCIKPWLVRPEPITDTTGVKE